MLCVQSMIKSHQPHTRGSSSTHRASNACYNVTEIQPTNNKHAEGEEGVAGAGDGEEIDARGAGLGVLGALYNETEKQ